jgi:hypothetical protein
MNAMNKGGIAVLRPFRRRAFFILKGNVQYQFFKKVEYYD